MIHLKAGGSPPKKEERNRRKWWIIITGHCPWATKDTGSRFQIQIYCSRRQDWHLWKQNLLELNLLHLFKSLTQELLMNSQQDPQILLVPKETSPVFATAIPSMRSITRYNQTDDAPWRRISQQLLLKWNCGRYGTNVTDDQMTTLLPNTSQNQTVRYVQWSLVLLCASLVITYHCRVMRGSEWPIRTWTSIYPICHCTNAQMSAFSARALISRQPGRWPRRPSTRWLPTSHVEPFLGHRARSGMFRSTWYRVACNIVWAGAVYINRAGEVSRHIISASVIHPMTLPDLFLLFSFKRLIYETRYSR